jgi:hypothetical protein
MMTVKSHFCPASCDALRRSGGSALASYYYGYFAAGADTV